MVVEQNAATGRLDDVDVSVDVNVTHLDLSVQIELAFLVRNAHLFGGVASHALALHRLVLGALADFGHVVQAQHHVLRRYRNRCSVRWVEDVVRCQHEQLRFQDGRAAEWQVNRHLVTIKVSVKCCTCERVQLNGLAFNQLRLERLNTQTVQRWCTVEQYRVSLHDVFKDVPNYRILSVYDFLRGLHRFDDAALNHLADDERLVQLGGHVLRQSTFVQLQVRANDDYGTCRVVHTLTEQVLTETSLLSFQTIRE